MHRCADVTRAEAGVVDARARWEGRTRAIADAREDDRSRRIRASCGMIGANARVEDDGIYVGD